MLPNDELSITVTEEGGKSTLNVELSSYIGLLQVLITFAFAAGFVYMMGESFNRYSIMTNVLAIVFSSSVVVILLWDGLVRALGTQSISLADGPLTICVGLGSL